MPVAAASVCSGWGRAAFSGVVMAALGGDSPDDDAPLQGHVVTHSLLGPVTRLSVEAAGGGDLVRVDVPSHRASEFPSGARVALDVDPAAALLAAP